MRNDAAGRIRELRFGRREAQFLRLAGAEET
jgi:hypothetical protein